MEIATTRTTNGPPTLHRRIVHLQSGAHYTVGSEGLGVAIQVPTKGITARDLALGSKVKDGLVRKSLKRRNVRARPDTWVTDRTGHIGYTFSLFKGGSDAL